MPRKCAGVDQAHPAGFAHEGEHEEDRATSSRYPAADAGTDEEFEGAVFSPASECREGEQQKRELGLGRCPVGGRYSEKGVCAENVAGDYYENQHAQAGYKEIGDVPGGGFSSADEKHDHTED